MFVTQKYYFFRAQKLNSKHKRRRKSKKKMFYFGPKRGVHLGVLYINRIKRNLYFTLTDLRGDVIGAISSRRFALSRKKRFNDNVILSMFKYLKKLSKRFYIRKLCLIFKILKKRMFRKTILRLSHKYIAKPHMILPAIPVPHNGLRKKKKRRL